jgi:hypothetical protein
MSEYTLNLILDELVKVRKLLETAQPSLYVSLSPSQVDVKELTSMIQAELLRQSQGNRGTHS